MAEVNTNMLMEANKRNARDDAKIRIGLGNHVIDWAKRDKTRAHIGLINHSQGRAAAMQIGVLNSFRYIVNNRCQLGFVNVTLHGSGVQMGAMNVSAYYRGAQVGMLNIAEEEFDGRQLGILCYSSSPNNRCLQLGILTVRRYGPWYARITPCFGFSSGKRAKSLDDAIDGDQRSTEC